MGAMAEAWQQQQEELERDDSEMMFYYQVEQEHEESERRHEHLSARPLPEPCRTDRDDDHDVHHHRDERGDR